MSYSGQLVEGKDLVNDSLVVIKEIVHGANSFRDLGQNRLALVGLLKSLFKGQLAMMRHFGYPMGIIERLADMEDYVISQTMKKEFDFGHLPFLPVVPKQKISIREQLSCIRTDGWYGSSGLRLDGIINLSSTPRVPYYLYDVDFTGILDPSPENNQYSRRGLLVEEVISLAVLVGIKRRDFVPSLSRYLSIDGRVKWLRLAKFDFPENRGSEVVLGVCEGQGLEERDSVPSCKCSLLGS